MMETLLLETAALPLARSVTPHNDYMFSALLLRCLGRAMQLTCEVSALYAPTQQMICCSRIGSQAMPVCRAQVHLCVHLSCG